MKLKRLLALLGGGAFCVALNSAFAEKVDVTSQYISNPNFEGTVAITNEYKTYHKDVTDGCVSGLIGINGWTPVDGTLDARAGGPVAYGSTVKLSGQNAPSKPDGGANETGLGIVAVWGATSQYLSDAVTLSAGDYTVTVKYYNTTSANIKTNLFGFKESGGTTHYGTNKSFTTAGSWTTETVNFTLESEATGQFSVGLVMDGGNAAAAHLFIDNIKVEYEGTGHSAPSLALRADLGDNISLANFVPAASNYTLEVEGTAGTPITVAGAGINYTPTTSGTIRFAKGTGSVYVYEGVEFKGVIAAGTPSFTPNIFTDGKAQESVNILGNGSFETLGTSVGTDIYEFGTPWTSNRAAASGGIRVGTSGSTHRLVWRGKGDSKYFGQPVTGLKPNRTYQVTICQVDQGNGWADFNVGIGAAAGGTELASNKFTLGRKANNGDDQYAYKGVWYTTFTTPSSIVESNTYYFTFANTNNGSHNDALTQIDWIALAEMGDLPITGVSSAKYTADGAFRPATPKDAYDDALAAAIAARDNSDYDIVTGSERTTLVGYINADEPTTADGYNTAASNLQNAANALIEAKSHYQALIDAQATVPDLAYASDEKAAFKTAEATSASDADAKVAAMPTNIRAYYESHALAEGVANAVNKTGLLANPDAMNANNGWDWTGTKNNPKNNEPWTDGSGSASHWYFDGGDWNNNSWTTTMSQTITLPAGTYLLTAKGRAAVNTTLTLAAGEHNVALPHVGSTGNVFDRGWGDASVEFTTASESEVEIKVTATSSIVHEWFSVGDFRLVRLDATLADATDYANLDDAISAAETKTLGFEDGEYAPYVNAAVLAKLAEAKAIDKNANNEKSDVQALTTSLNNATWTANTGDVDAIFNGLFSSDVEGDWGLTGWKRTNNWGQQQTGLSGDYATAYYNQPGSLQYGNQGVYTMPLKASQLYKLTFAYRSHENNSNTGVTVSVKNGDEGLASATFPANGSTSDWKVVEAYFTTTTAGNYVLTLGNGGNTWMTGVSLVKADEDDLKLAANPTNYTYYQNASLDREFSTANYSTLVLPFALDATETASAFEKAYTLTSVEGESLKFTATDAIAAGTPYLVKAKNATLSVTGKAIDPATTVTNTVVSDASSTVTFFGTFSLVNLTSANKNTYVVSNNTLYEVDSDVDVKAYRGYFTVDTTGGVKNFVLDFGNGETTSIEALESETRDKVIYNLAGQRVQKAQKGIFIVNGKKVVIK